MSNVRIRRYDIDALRVIAIGLLLIYHTAIGFQGWGTMIGFITNDTSLPALWSVMAIINIWRIPLLFFVSGMGVYFALQNRTWKQLFMERGRRIFIPFIFGSVVIVPIHIFILQSYYSLKPTYLPNPGHLWFLGNIFLYVILLFPIFNYLKKNADGKIVQTIKRTLSSPLGLLAVIGIFMIEALCTKPAIFELYAMTWHGFFMGLIFAPQMKVHTLLLVIESNLWIFTVFAFGYKYFNHNSKALKMLCEAVYPVYIVHMIVLYSISYWIFPLEMNAWIKFIIVVIGTVLGSFGLFLIIKKVRFIRPLFGLNR